MTENMVGNREPQTNSIAKSIKELFDLKDHFLDLYYFTCLLCELQPGKSSQLYQNIT